MNEPRIVYEDDHLLALAKPFGMPSQRDPSGDLSLIDWATGYLGRQPHLLHRLDRPTGGLNLLAKSSSAARRVSAQFEAGAVQKVYLAVVSGSLETPRFELTHFIAKLPGKNFVRAYDKPVRHSKEARLLGRVVSSVDELSLLELSPLTGRRHQIRAQLSRLKLSILGDFKYGRKPPALPYPGIALWAHRLTCSLTGPLEFSVPPPDLYPWNKF